MLPKMYLKSEERNKTIPKQENNNNDSNMNNLINVELNVKSNFLCAIINIINRYITYPIEKETPNPVIPPKT